MGAFIIVRKSRGYRVCKSKSKVSEDVLGYSLNRQVGSSVQGCGIIIDRASSWVVQLCNVLGCGCWRLSQHQLLSDQEWGSMCTALLSRRVRGKASREAEAVSYKGFNMQGKV